MADFRVEHRFNCSEESFWSKVFFDSEYNQRLFFDHLKFSGFRELKNEDQGEQVHRVVEAVPPIGDLPGPLKTVVGDGVGYEERGVFERKARRYQATVVPNRLADKISVKIEISTVADGPEHCKRIAQGSVNAKIFGVGGMLEKKMVADLQKSYEKSAAFTNAFVAEKSIR